MNSLYIYKKALADIKKADSNNVFDIAKSKNIELIYCNEFNKLLGMYAYMLKSRIILLSNNLDEQTERIVLAHELGHDALHRKLAKNTGLKEFNLYNMSSATEYEANAYASHILISDKDILELTKNGKDLIEISSILGCDVNLILIKLREMNVLGYNFKSFNFVDSTFLKNVNK